MDDEVNFVEVAKVLKVCPNCGYKDGFHSMFERVGAGNDLCWRLICPNCHKVFDIGLSVQTDK